MMSRFNPKAVEPSGTYGSGVGSKMLFVIDKVLLKFVQPSAILRRPLFKVLKAPPQGVHDLIPRLASFLRQLINILVFARKKVPQQLRKG